MPAAIRVAARMLPAQASWLPQPVLPVQRAFQARAFAPADAAAYAVQPL